MISADGADIVRNTENQTEQLLLGLYLGGCKTAIRDFSEEDINCVNGLRRVAIHAALKQDKDAVLGLMLQVDFKRLLLGAAEQLVQMRKKDHQIRTLHEKREWFSLHLILPIPQHVQHPLIDLCDQPGACQGNGAEHVQTGAALTAEFVVGRIGCLASGARQFQFVAAGATEFLSGRIAGLA